MITPEYIAGLNDVALEVLRPLVEELIEDICRRAAKAGEITRTAEYQAYRAKAMGASRLEIQKAIRKHARLSKAAIGELFQDIARRYADTQPASSLQQMVDAYTEVSAKQIARLMDKMGVVVPTGEVMPIGDAYGRIMDHAFKQVFTGAADYTTALRQATRKLANNGVRYIASEKRTVGIEYAARQNLMDQMAEMNEVVQKRNHEDLGCDGWEISAHRGSAPDHEPYQGRQYSDAEYERLNKVTLKRPIGDFSCGHDPSPIILGVNSPQYSETELQHFIDENAKGVTYEGRHYTLYEAGQVRSKIENSIRESKNRILADKALGDDTQLKTDQIRLGQLRVQYNRFCMAADLPTQNERLQVAGFGRSNATAARAALKRLVG